jgi:hypothetical protein
MKYTNVNNILVMVSGINHVSSKFVIDSSYSYISYLCNEILYNPWRYSSGEPWPAEQPPLAVFPGTGLTWSAHRIPQLHFQLPKPDRYFFIQVTTHFIRSRG